MFTIVAEFASIRTMLAIVVALDLEVHQMDIRNVFLNRKLSENIFME
jgi:hypothetical protein